MPDHYYTANPTSGHDERRVSVRALGLDQDKPHDDMTAIVMKVDVETQFNNRRILMTCPVPKYQSIFD